MWMYITPYAFKIGLIDLGTTDTPYSDEGVRSEDKLERGDEEEGRTSRTMFHGLI